MCSPYITNFYRAILKAAILIIFNGFPFNELIHAKKRLRLHCTLYSVMMSVKLYDFIIRWCLKHSHLKYKIKKISLNFDL